MRFALLLAAVAAVRTLVTPEMELAELQEGESYDEDQPDMLYEGEDDDTLQEFPEGQEDVQEGEDEDRKRYHRRHHRRVVIVRRRYPRRHIVRILHRRRHCRRVFKYCFRYPWWGHKRIIGKCGIMHPRRAYRLVCSN